MKRQDAGFTLLEMLVALVVFGLLMAGLSQTMRYGLASWTAESRGAAGLDEKIAVDSAIRRLIEHAAPDSFAGQPNSMEFTSTLPEGSRMSDRLADMALLVDGGRLVLRWTPHPAGVALRPPPAPHEVLLLDGVTAIRISYLAPQASGPPLWVGRWTAGGLPLLVRISITFADATTWPDLVAAPVAAQAADTEG